MRKIVVLVACAALTLAVAGSALAAVVTCTGGPCRGTERPDEITGTEGPDQVSALGGFDEVFAGGGEDELDGGRGGDTLAGQSGNDAYLGGKDGDYLSEFEGAGPNPDSGDDRMSGGDGTDYIEGNFGDDVIRGGYGDERIGVDVFTQIQLFGDEGDDIIYGGPGGDGLEGEEGTDEHYGGRNGDVIDAAADESTASDAPDLVACGRGFDRAFVLPNDIVRDDCEEVVDVSATTARAGAASGAADEEQRRARETFLSER